MMKRRIYITFLLCFILPLTSFAEELRVNVGAVHRIAETDDRIETTIDLREYIALALEPNEFIKGVEIKVEVPDRVLTYRNSFLLTLYKKVSPEPETSRKDYRAVLEYKQPFPQGKRLFIALPVTGREEWTPEGPGINRISPPLSTEDFPVLIGIKPVMKGIPLDVSRTSYPITIDAVTIEKGKLVLSNAPGALQKDATLTVDGKTLPSDQKEFFLSPGVHELSVTSPVTQPFTRTVGVEKGTETLLDLELEPAASRITFEAPKDARVYLDGEEIVDHRQAVEAKPGEHLVLVRLGEYTMSKKITIRKGENYQVSLFFDILIEKD
jgi:hypothetical protein